MKLYKQLRRAAPGRRMRGGRTVSKRYGHALPVVAALALVGSAVVTGAALVTALPIVPTTVPVLLAGWVAAIGLAFALPLLVVTGVVAALERFQ